MHKLTGTLVMTSMGLTRNLNCKKVTRSFEKPSVWASKVPCPKITPVLQGMAYAGLLLRNFNLSYYNYYIYPLW